MGIVEVQLNVFHVPCFVESVLQNQALAEAISSRTVDFEEKTDATANPLRLYQSD